MTPVASPVPEGYPRGSKSGGVLRMGCVWVLFDWLVGSSGFPLRRTHGNPGDRFLSIEISLYQMRVCGRNIEALLKYLRISV